MEFFVKKTSEFTHEELIEMNGLFNEVFDRDRSLEDMVNLYTKNPLGYSYHSIFMEGNQIVGMNVYVPYFYTIDGNRVLFANSIDSMIKKEHRDFFNFMDLVNTGYDYMKKEGVVFVYGFPNDNAYPLLTKSKLMREIGRMYTYCLPYRIGGIKKNLVFFNWASISFCRIWFFVSSIFASDKKTKYRIEKDCVSFNKTRYDMHKEEYKIEDGFVYRVIEFDGVKAAFLIDVFEKSSKNICNALSNIIKQDSKNFDIILYPGYLKSNNNGMIKIPHKYEPKRFSLCGRLLDDSFNSDIFWNIENWDVNLSNFDLI